MRGISPNPTHRRTAEPPLRPMVQHRFVLRNQNTRRVRPPTRTAYSPSLPASWSRPARTHRPDTRPLCRSSQAPAPTPRPIVPPCGRTSVTSGRTTVHRPSPRRRRHPVERSARPRTASTTVVLLVMSAATGSSPAILCLPVTSFAAGCRPGVPYTRPAGARIPPTYARRASLRAPLVLKRDILYNLQ